MKARIVTDSHAHEFRLLRNRIEAEIRAPAVVLVTSATDRDGAHLTAFGVAESLSKTHMRTALVMTSAADEAEPSAAASNGAPVQRRRASDRLDEVAPNAVGKVSTITISRERLATISRSNVASLVQSLHAEHDYVVIDGGDLPNNSFGLLLLTSADATLVTFLVGREQVPADRMMLDTLERAEVKVLGVVMNDEAAIEHFTRHEHEGTPEVSITAKKTASPLFQHFAMARQRIGKSF